MRTVTFTFMVAEAFNTEMHGQQNVKKRCMIYYTTLDGKVPEFYESSNVIDHSQNPTEQICCVGERGSVEGTWSFRERK